MRLDEIYEQRQSIHRSIYVTATDDLAKEQADSMNREHHIVTCVITLDMVATDDRPLYAARLHRDFTKNLCITYEAWWLLKDELEGVDHDVLFIDESVDVENACVCTEWARDCVRRGMFSADYIVASDNFLLTMVET